MLSFLRTAAMPSLLWHLAGLLLFADSSRLHQLKRVTPSEPLHPFAISRDEKGYLWIAAAQGVYRFDGRHYHRWPGYPFTDARFIKADRQGSVWVGGANGLARWRDGAWNVLTPTPVEAWAAAPDGIWWAGASLEFRDWNGKAKRFPGLRPSGQLTWTNGSLWFMQGAEYCEVRNGEARCQLGPLPGPWWQTTPDARGGQWFSSSTSISDGQRRWPVPHFYREKGQLDPIVSPAGRVWFTRGGLPLDFPSWTSNPASESCTEFVSETSRWVCLDEKAVGRFDFDPDWEYWSERSIPGLVGVVATDNGLPVSFTKRGVYRLDGKTREWRPQIPGFARDVRALERTPGGGLLLASQEEGLLEVTAEGRVLAKHHPCASIDTYRALRRDPSGRMWVGGKDPECFFEIKVRGAATQFVRQILPSGALQTVSIQIAPSGRVWVADEFGLAERQPDGTWQRILTDQPVRLIRGFSFASDDSVWISHRRPGYFTRIDRKGATWQVKQFRYEPADTHFIHVDSRGWIWRGTNQGVLIARSGHTSPDKWIRLDESSGAPLGSLTLNGFSEDSKGQVWLAGEEGLLRVRPKNAWFEGPEHGTPWISRVAVADKEWLEFAKLDALPAGAPIEIDFACPQASSFRPAPVEFRISGRTEWRAAPNATVTIPADTPSPIRLEVRYSGDNQTEIGKWTLTVTRPFSWTKPLWGLVALAVGAWTWSRRLWLRYWLQRMRFFLMVGADEAEGHLPAFPAGTLLDGRYRLGSIISRGGFSVTYRAADTRQDDAARVVKVLQRSEVNSGQVKRYFAHEVAAMRSLDHAGIAPLLDWFVAPQGEPCLVMPFVDGPTLRQSLQEDGPWPAARVAQLAEELGDALSAVHRQGLVHRDLKPENIILAPDHAKIIDFGVSAVRGPEGELEETTQIAGSIQYMAPERFLRQYSAASDIYSLGIILLETLTGRRLAQFPSLPVEPDFVEHTSPWIGREVTQILVEALRHQPSRRPQNAKEWAQRLSERLRAEQSAKTSRTGNPPSPATPDVPGPEQSR